MARLLDVNLTLAFAGLGHERRKCVQMLRKELDMNLCPHAEFCIFYRGVSVFTGLALQRRTFHSHAFQRARL